jgi:serine/threonine protein phosphatase PrpC
MIPEVRFQDACTDDHHADHDQAIMENDEYMIISQSEAMNPTKRATMEDVCVVCKPGEWGAPDKDMSYIGVYDGHGGETSAKIFFCK